MQCCGPTGPREESKGLASLLERLQMPLTIACGVSLAMMFASMIPNFKFGDEKIFAWAAVGFGSIFALRSMADSIMERSLDVNLLMVLAAAGAIYVGHVDDAAVLLFLFSLSSSLEALAMSKTESAIEALVKLKPNTALKVVGDSDEQVAVESLEVGDTVRVRPFEPVPTDGELLTDEVSINESAMTGESAPAPKVVGDRLLAGTQNLDRMLLMRVTAESRASTLDKILDLVREAQENKASGERVSAWFGARYTIIVVVAFVASLGIRMASGQTWDKSFYDSLILLVALSPCALVISSPAASLSALAFAARRGILVRGGQYLEAAGRITTVALDKTGTLTSGKFQVVEVCVGSEKLPVAVGTHECSGPGCETCCPITCWHHGETLHEVSHEALRLAAGAEAFSTHPIAEAIVSYAKSIGLTIPSASTQQVLAGLGVEAEIEGQRVRAGQLKLFDEHEMPIAFREHVEEMRTRGLTAVLLHAGDVWAAIGLRDAPRPEAASFIRALHESGVKRIAMLTGDNLTTANAVANELGVDQVHAALMPDEKYALVKGWSDAGEHVMMVGDGVNDAPALSAASLGIAMGGLGSEAALRAADVVLVQDRIERLPLLIRLGKSTNRIIMGNLIFAAGIIVLLTVGSFFGKVPLPLAVVGHEGSTFIVVLNGLRLLRGPTA